MTEQDAATAAQIDYEGEPDPWNESEIAEALIDCPASYLTAAGRHAAYGMFHITAEQIEVVRLTGTSEYAWSHLVPAIWLQMLKHHVLTDRQAARPLVWTIHERNLPAQLFAARCGLRAVHILPRHFTDGDDGFHFTIGTDVLSTLNYRGHRDGSGAR
jgi:hypothetical protein